MIIGPFSTLNWGDNQQLQQWQQVHDSVHLYYAQNSQVQGATAYHQDFNGPINDDWFTRHLWEHKRLVDLVGSTPTPTAAIDVEKWYAEDDFHWWHFYHNRLHATLDSYFGL